MACFFYSKEQLETKLLYAINADAGFDLSWLTHMTTMPNVCQVEENCR